MNYEELIDRLREEAEEADLIGDRAKHDDLVHASDALQKWLRDGGTGQPPQGVIERIDALLGETIRISDKAETAPAPRPPSEPSVRARRDRSQPATIEATPDPETAGVGLVTPSDVDRQRRLARARQLIRSVETANPGDLNEVVSLARSLLDDPEIGREAAQIGNQAQDTLNRRLAEALRLGDEARSKGQLDEAYAYYQTALTLNPGNDRVRRATLELDESLTGDLSELKLRELRQGLKEKQDVRRLGEAVYEAEILADENKLPPELVRLLQEARPAFDGIRRQHGIQTTMMRFGVLQARKDARDAIQDELIAGARTMMDIVRGEYRTTVEVLNDANRLLEEASQDTAQYELDRVNNMLPAHPQAALEHLRRVLAEKPLREGQDRPELATPFAEREAARLRLKEDEVKALLAAQTLAEAELEKANRTDEPMEALQYTLAAQSYFPHLPGLEARLERARQTAAGALTAQVLDLHNQARTLSDNEKYNEARQKLAEADKLPARWPEEDRPPTLKDVENAGKALRARIDAEASTRREFEQYATEIRVKVEDSATRQQGMDLFREIAVDERFKELPQLRSLRIELDNYRDVSQQVEEARLARGDRDWNRLEDVALKIEKSGKAGQFAAEVASLLALARLEKDLAAIDQELAAGEIGFARSRLERLLEEEADAKRHEALARRLAEQQKQIREAEKNSPAMEKLYQQALTLAREKDLDRQLEALRLFRYVSGLPGEPDAKWPAYRLSLRTGESRRKAGELREKIRAEHLPYVMGAQQGGQSFDESQLARRADLARKLRDALLLDTNEEREAADRLIIRQLRQDAQAKEAVGDWDAAVNIWADLDKHYAREVEEEYRWARVRQALMHADRFIKEQNYQSAVDVLEKALASPDMGKFASLYLKLADAYAARGEYGLAFTALDSAEGSAEDKATVQQKRETLRRDQAVGAALQAADQAGDPKEAIRLLQAALKEPRMKGSERLQQRMDEIYAAAATEQLKTATLKIGEGGLQREVEAVVALVDLRELEELAEIPEDQRRSPALLKQLQNRLEPAARVVLQNAREFNPATLSLEQALHEATELTGRLMTFVGIPTLLGVELGALQTEIARMSQEQNGKLDRLRKLRDVLSEANEPKVLQRALATGDFAELEQYRRQALAADFPGMLDVERFSDRVSEWKAAHDYLAAAIYNIRRDFLGSRRSNPTSGDESLESVEENFEAVSHRLPQLPARPERRPDNGGQWQLTQDDYSQIHRDMGNRLVVEDLYSNHNPPQPLVGWKAVEAAAAERHRALQAWEEWAETCEQLMDNAELRYNEALRQLSGSTLVQRRNQWEGVVHNAQQALKTLQSPPKVDGHDAPVQSRRAEMIEKEGKRRQRVAQRWLKTAVENMPTERDVQFPTADEFNQAAHSTQTLKELIDKARQIGPSNVDEETRLRYYENTVLPKLSGRQQQRSFLDKLFGR